MASGNGSRFSNSANTFRRYSVRPEPTANSKVNGNGSSVQEAERKILNSWKEVAAYMGLGVRTIQRYEAVYGLPIRRIAARDRTAVMAFSDELNDWLNQSAMRERRYVRPTLVVIDRAVPGTISSRKLTLEVARFNVLTAYSAEEAYSTAQKFDVEGFVLDESLKESYPKKPIFGVAPVSFAEDGPKGCCDYVVRGDDAQDLLTAVMAVFGTPRLE